jgi:hypothetical protein
MRLRERFSRTWWLALLFGQVGVAVAQDRPPEPVFEAWTAGGCPADAGLRYDVSAIGGADRIRWQLRRGAGTLPVASGTEMGVSGRARMDFRAYGPVLEGSEYLGRIRAFQGDTPALDAWSNNSRWSATAAPDGMYSVADASQSGQYQVRLQWTLGGAIASCADRIHYEIKKDAPFTSTSGPDASAQAGSFGTVTGNQAIALPQGPGDYYVRLVARHGTDTPAHDVGKWGAAKRITIQPPQTVSCDDLAPTGMFSVTPVIQASAPQYRLKIDWTLTGGLAACADRITYELMKGHAFASDALDPLTYMAGTFSGTSGSSLVFLPEGADDYWVRILARQGGDTRNNDVGLRSAAVQVSVSATRHEVAIKVIDDAASKCAGSTVPASGATVRLVSADGNQQSAVADVEGMARLSVLGGSYAMSATRQSCGSRSEDLTVNAKLDTSIGLPGCVADGADLAVLLSSSSTSPVGGQTYPLTVTLRSVGTGAASPASVLVERREQGASAATRLFKKDVPQICRGDEQTLSTTDPTPEAGKTYTYVARLNLRATDANPNNNSASRAVAFAGGAGIGAAGGPVAVSDFAIRNGLPYVTVGRSITLDASATGNPDAYRAVQRTRGCGRDLGATQWKPWSPISPPTVAFSSEGPKEMCFQLRRGSGDTAETSPIVRDEIVVVIGSAVSAAYLGTLAPPGVQEPYALVPGSGTLTCRNGFAVGVDTRAGFYVDAVALRCATLGPNGQHQDAFTTSFYGGAGGERRNLRCNNGEVVTHLRATYSHFMERLEVGCSPWTSDTGAAESVRWIGAAGGTGPQLGPGGTLDGGFSCRAALGVSELTDVHSRTGPLPGSSYLAAFKIACAAPAGM